MNYKEKLRSITTFIFDVDGVLTDGQVLVFPGQLIRSLNAKDGYALQYASKLGYSIFVVTGGNSEDVKESLLRSGVKEVFLQSSDKIAVYENIKATYNLVDDEIAYMGDDIPDLKVMQRAFLASCPQDAVPEIKAISDYHSPYKGGRGCVRDLIEQTLKVQGKWLLNEAHTW